MKCPGVTALSVTTNDATLTDRRTVLRTVAGGVAASGLFGSVGAASEWTAAEPPTGNNLYDVEHTTAGAYAAGGGGTVVERTGKGWRKTFDGGPTGNGNSLYGTGVTEDGERLWVVGGSGAIGEYDVRTGNLVDRSAPNDVTNNFNDVAVTGTAGEANVYVAGDSGKIYYSFENGETGSWNEVTPGSGSNVNAVDFFDVRAGHAVDGNKTVFETDDGTTYEKLGIEDADYNFYGVDADAPDDVWVAGGGGSVYRWNGSEWRRENLGDADLRDVTVTDDDTDGLTVGGGGTVFELTDGRWRQESTPTGANLAGVVRGTTDIAVGASGTVLER
ncbi:hypothetical protein BRD18_00135 [Halobacteriales archaeon SW_7_71_33]|nr:MAG: hypothetical protein BRD18_00135 [Halobacteriales archaeon SW_7_71_33]